MELIFGYSSSAAAARRARAHTGARGAPASPVIDLTGSNNDDDDVYYDFDEDDDNDSVTFLGASSSSAAAAAAASVSVSTPKPKPKAQPQPQPWAVANAAPAAPAALPMFTPARGSVHCSSSSQRFAAVTGADTDRRILVGTFRWPGAAANAAPNAVASVARDGSVFYRIRAVDVNGRPVPAPTNTAIAFPAITLLPVFRARRMRRCDRPWSSSSPASPASPAGC